MICQRCGCKIEYVFGRPPKYCKECAKKKAQQQSKHWKRQHRNLGTSDFWEHRFKDFGKEYNAIQREKKRLGI